MKRIIFLGFIFLLILVLIALISENKTKETVSEGILVNKNNKKYTIIAKNLEIPWEVSFLPGGDILVTERSGSLVKIEKDSSRKIEVEGVEHRGEGGLLGMAIHPDFENNRFLYLYLTTSKGDGLENRIERYKLVENSLNERKVVFEGIPGAIYHDGGRMEFGPDGFLYVTTGDARNPSRAQNIDYLGGKILRLNDDGSIPENNPFVGSPVYSYGHRNPQGMAWDNKGRLWVTEHGRSGARSGLDEINLIEKGGNYGWPIIEGDEEREGMISPAIHSGPDTTWAPAGMIFRNGKLYFTGLRGSALYEIEIDSNQNIKNFQKHFKDEFGRLRAVELGPDNEIYITTSNRDGRGEVQEEDDKLLRVNVEN